VTRILAIADEVNDGLYGETLKELRPDLVIGCGDLPFDYLENIVSRLDVPLLFVPGNHDPDLQRPDARWLPLSFDGEGPGPGGCVDVDGRIVEAAGLVVAGLGGSPRYRPGPNQYTESQMRRRALRLRLRLWLRRAAGRRPLDVLVTHTPPAGEDADQDAVHRGFPSLAAFDEAVQPRLHVHGHTLQFGPRRERRLGATRVVNVIPYRLLEL
jgi:uncharacterized protein